VGSLEAIGEDPTTVVVVAFPRFDFVLVAKMAALAGWARVELAA
jgi:hypothetical protein